MKTSKNDRINGIISGRYFVEMIAVLALLMAFHVAGAQKKWNVEIRTGVNIPTKDLGDANLKTGAGIEGTISYKFMQHLALYTGWSWNRFSADQSFMGSNMDFEETGYNFGLQFIHPIQQSPVNYMVKGGAIYNHIETENSDGKIINDTDHGWGWQIGTGIVLPLGKRLQLIPEVRYRSLSRDIRTGDVTTAVDLNYISAGAGLSWSF